MNAPKPAPSTLWLLVGSDGAVRSCAPASEQLLGISPLERKLEELFGEDLAQRLLNGPEDIVEPQPPNAGRGSADSFWHLERHRLADGGLLVRGNVLKPAGEEVPAAWERRITRRLINPNEDVIGQQRTFMLSIFDADPNLIFVKDRRGRFVFVNKATAGLFDVSPDEVVLQHNAEVHHNEDELKIFDEVDRRVITLKEEVILEESFTKGDGAVAWYVTHKRPLQAPNGETFVLGISVDITERRNIQQLLHETNQRLELAVGAGQLGLWDWDITAGTLYLSATWKVQLGYTDSELPNTMATWTSRIHLDDKERVLQVMDRHVRDPSSGDRFINELRMRARDDSWRWIASYGLVVRNPKGEGVRVTGYHVDITERKEREAAQEQLRDNLRRTNEHLEQVGRMKDEFLASMSHELRTPLNAVLGQAEAMSEGIFGPLTEAQRSALQTIEESGQHLLSLINDVLDVTKSNAGHLELELAPVPVEEVCQESLRLVREQARRKNLSTRISVGSGVVSVWADRRRLRQVLLNLLSNATKFTEAGGSFGLEVTVRSAGAAVAFTVWDTGCGIASKDRQRIFEPFVQLDSGLARRNEGSGLGLTLVRRLVELQHGTLELESEEGKGSRFTVVLPAEQPSALMQTPATLSPSAPILLPRPSGQVEHTVLVADDNEANVRHLEGYLLAHGFRVRIARDGEEAVRMAREEKPSVVLMDIQMPHVDGLEAIRRLRADAETSRMAMVALTALAMPGDRERCMAAGADTYLSKPVRLKELLEVIERLISGSETGARRVS